MKKYGNISCSMYFFWSACFIILKAQENLTYKIVNANTQEIFNRKRTELTGNVILKRDTIRIYCDKAIFFDEKRIYLTGAVKILNGMNSMIHSEIAKFDKNKKYSRFYKNVDVRTPTINARSDSMWFNNMTKQFHFFQNVKIVNTVDSSEIFGDRVISETNNNFTVYNTAKYFSMNDSMTVLSDLLHFDRQKNVATATGHVEIFRNKLRATAKRSQFNNVDSLIKLYGEAVFHFGNNEMRGDSIFASLSARGIKRIDIHGSAQSISVLDSASQKINRISGRDIYLYFSAQKIRRLRSLRNAISIYYFQENMQDTGTNSVSADSLHVDFHNGQVVKVQIFGGVQGTFYPPNYRGIIKNDY